MRWGTFGAVAAVIACMLVPACSNDDANVPEASCSVCAGKAFTEADCKAAGDAAGCASSTLVASVPNCINGCKFESCREPPTCAAASTTRDSGAADAAVDPACANGPKGLFASKPPCTDVSTVTINGATQYACKCGQPCPCGFTCGSIALAQGGTLGNVCAPP
jgi:hypothetical protein